MVIKLLIDDYIKEICINAVRSASHGEKLYLAEPQHVDYYTKIAFNTNNPSHLRYLERGLFFSSEADALLFTKSYLNRL